MKRYLTILLISLFNCGIIYAQTKSVNNNILHNSGQAAPTWSADPSNFPGNIKAFLENKGQFQNTYNDWKVIYGCDYQGTRILFTDKGVIYTVPQLIKLDDGDAKHPDPKTQAEEPEEENKNKTVYHTVSVAWENSSPDLTIENIGERPDYFGYMDPVNFGKGIDHIKGYQKLIYHNVYPGIDIEYSFHEKSGIKYTITVKAGYSADKLKMLYSGQQSISLDETGNIHITTPAGDIIDHAPISFQKEEKVASSFTKTSDNEIAFEIAKRNSNSDLVIDPWVNPPTITTFIPDNIHMDAANNVYIFGSYAAGGFGSSITMYEQKYTTAGALAWTQSYSQYVGGVDDESDFTVDPAGNSYVPAPYLYSNSNGRVYAMVSYSTNDVLNYFYNTYNSNAVAEVWNIAYSCTYDALAQAGVGPQYTEGELALITPSNGNLGGTYNTPYPGSPTNNPAEIYAGCIAPNGFYYGLASNLGFFNNPSDNTVTCWNISGATPAVLWTANTGYNYDDYETKTPYSVASNGIAASCAYLYTTNGLSLDQRSLTTGAIIKTVTIPNGNNGSTQGEDFSAPGNDNSGIAIDLACGYVYIGTKGSVQIYDANLNLVTTQAVPAGGIVYDVTFNNGLVSACGATAGGNGFVVEFAAQTCPALTITHVSTTCGLPNGTANLATPTFCAAPYNYTWSNGATTQNVTGLAAGTYTVNVGTQGGCVTEADTVIIGPSNGVTVTATPTSGACAGSITTSVTTGVAPFTYSWSNGATTSSITGVGAGTYTVTVTDSKNCVQTATATITSSPIVVNTTSSPTTCTGTTGTAGVTSVTGGTSPYTYSWNGGQTTSTISNLAAGSYTVTVKDANNCTQPETVVVGTTGATIIPTATETDVLCNGQSNGSVSVTGATGGAAPYTYTWSGGQTTTTVTGLAIGTYTVTAKDNNGCTGQTTITINQPPLIVVNTTSSPTTCTGSTGSAGVTSVTGGVSPYTYSWAGGQTTSTISNLAAGSYTVTVKDANSCTQPETIVVGSTGATIIPTATETNVLCNGQSTGTATVSGSTGGTAPYTYTWSSGQTTTTVNGLPAGTYTVTSKDNTGCVGQTTVTITQPTPLQLSSSAVNASCHGECNGQLLSLPSGGTSPYTYAWSNGATSASESNVCPATYSIVVKDANGCTVDSTGLVVGQPTAITGTTTTTPAQCNQADGGACLTASGGTGAYTYSWNTGITTTCISNVLGGPYSVIITDANNCKDTVKVTVPNLAADSVVITATNNVTCFGGNNGSITSQASGGVAPYTYSWNTNPVQTNATASNLMAGTYTVTVQDASPGGCPVTAVATITQPTLVVATPPAPVTICIGDSTKLTVSATGGTGPYTYSWAPGGLTGATVTVKPANNTTYTITPTDANGCPGAPVQVVVSLNPPLTVKVTPNKATCPGGNVTIGATAGGGDGIYTYTWSPPTGLSCTVCQNPVVTPTVTTQYTVTVNDNCGTPAVKDSVIVTVDPLPNVLFTADTMEGCSPLCVIFTDKTTIASGGLFSWAWSFGDDSVSNIENPPLHCYNNPGVYTVGLIVKSDSGCVDSLTIPNMITVYSHPIAAFTASPQPATIISPQITFTDQSTDIYGITNWFWQFEDPLDGTSTIQNPKYTYADTGTYCPKLTVTNKHGCVDSVQHCIVIDPFFTLYIPNAFTPNNDGENDVFNVKGTYICGFSMYIFDRWGMQLYYTTDLNKGWDGRVNGGTSMAQEDTYVYLIEATDCVAHQKHQYIGRVSIIK
jgi:gliding motility-associated-like protein